MSARNIVESRFTIDGKPVIITLINNPTIDDVLSSEARVQATAFERGTVDPNRRVSRDIRNFLIELEVDR